MKALHLTIIILIFEALHAQDYKGFCSTQKRHFPIQKLFNQTSVASAFLGYSVIRSPLNTLDLTILMDYDNKDSLTIFSINEQIGKWQSQLGSWRGIFECYAEFPIAYLPHLKSICSSDELDSCISVPKYHLSHGDMTTKKFTIRQAINGKITLRNGFQVSDIIEIPISGENGAEFRMQSVIFDNIELSDVFPLFKIVLFDCNSIYPDKETHEVIEKFIQNSSSEYAKVLKEYDAGDTRHMMVTHTAYNTYELKFETDLDIGEGYLNVGVNSTSWALVEKLLLANKNLQYYFEFPGQLISSLSKICTAKEICTNLPKLSQHYPQLYLLKFGIYYGSKGEIYVMEHYENTQEIIYKKLGKNIENIKYIKVKKNTQSAVDLVNNVTFNIVIEDLNKNISLASMCSQVIENGFYNIYDAPVLIRDIHLSVHLVGNGHDYLQTRIFDLQNSDGPGESSIVPIFNACYIIDMMKLVTKGIFDSYKFSSNMARIVPKDRKSFTAVINLLDLGTNQMISILSRNTTNVMIKQNSDNVTLWLSTKKQSVYSPTYKGVLLDMTLPPNANRLDNNYFYIEFIKNCPKL